MLKERNGKADRLYQKTTKSFAKAIDINLSVTASQLRLSCAQININYSNRAQRQAVSQRPLFCPWAFFIHRLKNRKARKALSFAQLRKGIIGMS